jgi:galactokinase
MGKEPDQRQAHSPASGAQRSTTALAITKRFRQRYGGAPRIFQAPGRINIIGEHTDYCGGLVMPAAIEQRCFVAVAANGTRRLRVTAAAFSDEASGNLDALRPVGGWFDYVAGVAHSLMAAGIAVLGADLWIESLVPIGSGVSSSAALEVSVAHALLSVAGQSSNGVQIAKWAQAAENGFVGMPCGIMDQYASANGVAGAALMLDCDTLACTPISLPDGVDFLLIDSTVRHAHVEGAYRSRREDCEAAARILDIPLLAHLAPDGLETALARLSGNPAKRCRHVVSECGRVRAAAAALGRNDVATLGRLINASHASLRDDMEVSVPEVDRLAAIAQQTPGVLGARMMGGGFGGNVIALVRREAASDAEAAIVARFGAWIGVRPTSILCRAAAGAGEVGS